MGSIQILFPERNELHLLACRGFHPVSAAFWEWVRIDSASSCGLALSAGARIVVPDVDACDFMAGTEDLDAYRRSGIRAVQSTPLVSRSGQLLGMISTHWREPHQPTEHDLRPLDVLARQAADLIERARIEAALRESEQQSRWLAAIVESSDDSIVSIDLDGTITSWNKGAGRIFGYFAEEVIGKPITILIPPDRHDEEQRILERVRCGERVEHYETVRQCKHGRLIDISLTVSPIRNIHDKVIGASKIARDITEGKRREVQIAILAREAEHRTCWRVCKRRCTSHIPTRLTASSAQSRDASSRSRTSTGCSWNRAGPEPTYAGLVTQELSPYFREGDGQARIEGPQ